tara:strand:- start:28 stop:795 length:768 start_codon:yes stop_codon:yes gene_type:complete
MLKTSKFELKKLLKKLGLKKNDTVLVHSSFLSLGIVTGGIETLHNSLIETLGPKGNLIVPTFTFSFRRNKIFNFHKTKCCKSVGVYPEYFRRLSNSIRSADPLFSMCCIGPDAKLLMKRETKNCFGDKSIFDKLVKKNCLVLGLGIRYSTGFPIFMHVEKKANVRYRKNTIFTGVTISSNYKKIKDKAVHFARDEKNFPRIVIDREEVGKILEKKKISKNLRFKYGRAISFRSLPFLKTNLKLLKKYPDIFIKKK